jgi:hypothetical protein
MRKVSARSLVLAIVDFDKSLSTVFVIYLCWLTELSWSGTFDCWEMDESGLT